MTTVDELESRGLGDYQLLGITWLQEPSSIVMTFARERESDDVVRLAFRWVSDLKIDLDFAKYDGVPFVFESHVQALENRNGWRFELRFDGTPTGELSLLCSELEIVDQ